MSRYVNGKKVAKKRKYTCVVKRVDDKGKSVTRTLTARHNSGEHALNWAERLAMMEDTQSVRLSGCFDGKSCNHRQFYGPKH